MVFRIGVLDVVGPEVGFTACVWVWFDVGVGLDYVDGDWAVVWDESAFAV